MLCAAVQQILDHSTAFFFHCCDYTAKGQLEEEVWMVLAVMSKETMVFTVEVMLVAEQTVMVVVEMKLISSSDG